MKSNSNNFWRAALTAADVRRIVNALATATPVTRTVVTLALCTGARAQELQQLRWNDVDTYGGVVRFRGGKVGSYSVPLAPDLAAALAEWRALQARGETRPLASLKRPHVLGGRSGPPLSTESILGLFARHAEKACGHPFSIQAARSWVRRRELRTRGL
jgi:integrase